MNAILENIPLIKLDDEDFGGDEDGDADFEDEEGDEDDYAPEEGDEDSDGDDGDLGGDDSE